MAKPTSLCVYCGSSIGTDPRHTSCAEQVGREAAQRGLRLVFGGGSVGLMGKLADAALAEGGEVIGIIPDKLKELEVGHLGLTRLEVVDSMHARKKRMADLSDAFCVLPGGFGTLDELFEIVTWRQLGYHDKPVFVVDQDSYWHPLIELVRHQVNGGYVSPSSAELMTFVNGVDALFEALLVD